MNRTVLHASTGNILTNGEVYGKIIYLAENSSADEYYEITEEEYLKLINIDTEDKLTDEATEKDYQSALKEFGVQI